MGKMKELLDKRLDENKYEMWEALKQIQKWLLLTGEITDDGIWNEQFIKANNLTAKVLAKIEKL